MRDRGSPAELEHRRLLAVQRVLEGYSTGEVAEVLGVDPRSVRRWVAAYRRDGGPGLLARPVSGRPSKLTATQEKIIRRWLADSPAEHGFNTGLWTAARIGQLIREEFGIGLNPRYLSSWLRDRGFTPQKPERVPRERDPKAIAAWLESDWPRIKKARRQHARIVLIDESGLLMGPLPRRTWAPRGQTPSLVQRGARRQKVSVIASLGLSPRRGRLRLDDRTLADAYFDNWSVAGYLEAMVQGLGGRFVVVWDGGNMHKGDPIRDLEGRFSDRLVLERLPPFAPMLNPVEALWSWLKWSRLSNFAPHNVRELEDRVTTELESVREDQAFLRNLFHASELPLPRTLLS